MVDPCKTTVLTDFSVPDVSIEAGLTDNFLFSEVTDSAATAVSKPTICGARTYTVYKLDAQSKQQAQTLVTFIAGANGAKHTLKTVTMNEDQDVGVHNMRLVVSLPD